MFAIKGLQQIHLKNIIDYSIQDAFCEKVIIIDEWSTIKLF